MRYIVKHISGWCCVIDTETGAEVCYSENFTLAWTLCCTWNGVPVNSTEEWQMRLEQTDDIAMRIHQALHRALNKSKDEHIVRERANVSVGVLLDADNERARQQLNFSTVRPTRNFH